MYYYFVYKVVNIINNNFYIGAHRTKDINDNYLGSGKIIGKAIKKHGRNNFTREILKFFDTEQEMYDYEAEIVTFEFIQRRDTYNMKLGGYTIPPEGFNTKGREALRKKYAENPELKSLASLKSSETLKMKYLTGELTPTFLGKKHSSETKEKIKEAHAINGYQKGDKNSQRFSFWVFNEKGERKKVKKDGLIPEGFAVKISLSKPKKTFNLDVYNLRLELKKEDKIKRINRLKEEKIKELYPLYELYKKVGFEEFKKITNYQYSKQNLVMSFAKYLDDFIPQNGKKRGN